MSNVIISLDPSFTRTGICVIDLHNKTICFHTVSCKIGEKQFENIVHAAQSIVNGLKAILNEYVSYDLIFESPLPMSSMSSALYSLGTLIYHTFQDHVKCTYNPATLRSKIHGHKYDKKDSSILTDKYLTNLKNNGYTVTSILGTKKKIPHDSAEAFLYAWLYLHELKHTDFMFDNSSEIASYKVRMRELKKREKLLLSNNEPQSI